VTKPQVPGQFWFEYSFARDHMIRDERLEIDVPRDKAVKMVSPERKPEVTDEGTRRIYRWASSNLERKEESAGAGAKRFAPNPDVQVTTFASWEEVGRWYGALQQDAIKITPAIQTKATELTKGLKIDEEKVQAIYSFVALRIHYIGLEFGIGRYQPHDAEDVLENAYGDCKDKHTLLAALLRAAGYDAWPALVHGGRKLDSDVPSPAQFNHVITVISLGGKLTWVDTTPEVSPYGLLLANLRDKQALVVPGGQAPKLMNTPADAPFPQKQTFSTEGKLDAEGTFTGHIEQSYRGDTEVLIRLAFRQTAEAQWKDLVQGLSYRLGFGGDVSDVHASSLDDTTAPFRVSYDYRRKDYSDWANRQFTPPLPGMGIEAGNDGNEKPPTEPYYLGATGEILYQARMELPQGYSVTAPQSVDLVEPYAEYHATHQFQNGVLTSSRHLVIKQPEVPAKDWEQYRIFRKAVADDQGNYIRLQTEETKASERPPKLKELDRKFTEATEAARGGDFHRAEDLLNEVVAAEPDYPSAQLALGFALAAEQKVSDALAALSKAEEVAPGDERSFTMRASILTSEGRSDEALQEWRRLLTVDPGNRLAAVNLANSLAARQEYAAAAQVAETALKSLPNDRGLKFLLGSMYLKNGQTENGVQQLHEAAEKVETAGNVSPEMLNDIAYTLADNDAGLELARKYAQEAITELESRSKASDTEDAALALGAKLAMTWDTLGWVYYRMNDVDRAESYVRAAWLLGQHEVVGDHLGQIYERQGKKQQAAHLYQLALASSSTTPKLLQGAMPSPLPFSAMVVRNSHRREDEIRSHYEKLTGKQPITASHRLPNGEWTPTPAEELSRMRTVKLGKLSGFAGSGEFSIIFTPGKVEAARYVSGEPGLKPLTEKLTAAKYPVEFPEGSTARIVRRAMVMCTSVSGCDVVLLLPGRER
jgi:tetratricopeptide (TPR) repeat protein/transglutaminase-like putative cysteine protease